MKTRLIGAILAIVLAIAGTFVLTNYVGGADARAAKGAELVSVYLVKKEIPKGTEAKDVGSFLQEKKIPAIAAAPGHVTTLSNLSGTVAEVSLKPGEQLIRSRWVSSKKLAATGDADLPAGMQAVSVDLPVEQVVGDTIKAGDTVGVVITSNPNDGNAGVVKEKLHKVLVTAVRDGSKTTSSGSKDTSSNDSAEESEPVDSVMVTLAATTPNIETIVWGQRFGSVWLTFEPKDADEAGSRVVDYGGVFQ